MPDTVYRDGYPVEMVNRVRDLYVHGGMTISEVAEELNSTYKVVWRLMDRHDIPRRVAAKRDQWGERNHQWRSDDAGYSALHFRVEKRLGKPQRCELCGTTDPAKHYDWHCDGKRYTDIDAYVRLCRSCHRTAEGMSIADLMKGGDNKCLRS